MSLPPIPTLDQVCERALKLPCSPALLPELMAAIRGRETTGSEIEKIVSQDSALAAATLRLANSAFSGRGQSIANLQQAILLIGHKEIYQIASLALFCRWEFTHRAALPWEPGEYGRRSLCTALAAEVIAEASEQIDPQVAYTAGLVGDLGALVLGFTCAPFYPLISIRSRAARMTWAEAERSVLGYCHVEVGARLLRSWGFPEPFAQVVELQARPEEAPEAVRPLLAHVHASRYLAAVLGPGLGEGGFLFLLQGQFLAQWGFTTEFLEEALIEVRERATLLLGESLTHGALHA